MVTQFLLAKVAGVVDKGPRFHRQFASAGCLLDCKGLIFSLLSAQVAAGRSSGHEEGSVDLR
jgi:hypothetical protein